MALRGGDRSDGHLRLPFRCSTVPFLSSPLLSSPLLSSPLQCCCGIRVGQVETHATLDSFHRSTGSYTHGRASTGSMDFMTSGRDWRMKQKREKKEKQKDKDKDKDKDKAKDKDKWKTEDLEDEDADEDDNKGGKSSSSSSAKPRSTSSSSSPSSTSTSRSKRPPPTKPPGEKKAKASSTTTTTTTTAAATTTTTTTTAKRSAKGDGPTGSPFHWDPEQVAAWLRSPEVNVPYIAPIFKELNIDGSMLMEVHDKDLVEDFRVTNAADRGRIVKALAALNRRWSP